MTRSRPHWFARSWARSTGRPRAAFSLVEAMIAISMLALVGSVLLSASQATLSATGQSTEQTIAYGIARQFLDEAVGLPFVSHSFNGPGNDPNTGVFSATLGGANGTGVRTGWDDCDDADGAGSGYSSHPVQDRWGQEFGQGNGTANTARQANFRVRDDFFDSWRVETEVYNVDPNNFSSRTSTTNSTYYRAIEVRVYRQQPSGSSPNPNPKTPLATLRRVHVYVPKCVN